MKNLSKSILFTGLALALVTAPVGQLYGGKHTISNQQQEGEKITPPAPTVIQRTGSVLRAALTVAPGLLIAKGALFAPKMPRWFRACCAISSPLIIIGTKKLINKYSNSETADKKLYKKVFNWGLGICTGVAALACARSIYSGARWIDKRLYRLSH